MTHVARMPRSKLEKPRPLNIPSNHNRYSMQENHLGTVEEIMAMSDVVATNLTNVNYDSVLKTNIKTLHNVLKLYGSKLEAIYKDQLDRNFVSFRNASRNEAFLDYGSRLLLLELIELRAKHWNHQDTDLYYKNKNSLELEIMTPLSMPDMTYAQSPLLPQNVPLTPISPSQPQQLLLGPGELVKSSGKYPAPTRVVGKNYCKDEVVIRNSDSGKVMGIKGRRVHMIEELSETVISFQRVNPGAKERLVQITGPTEHKIEFAKQLIEDTIKRNASPVRAEPDSERPASNSSLTDSDDILLPQQNAGSGPRSSLLHSFSTNDATLGEYKYTVTVGDENLKITGSNLDLVRIAKLVLDEYFTPDGNEQDEQYSQYYEEDQMFEHIETKPVAATGTVRSPDSTSGLSRSMRSISISEPEPADVMTSSITPAPGLLTYSPEEIIRYLDSPLSRKTPENWTPVTWDCSSILKKTPIDWINSSSVLKTRAQDFPTNTSHSSSPCSGADEMSK